jgi:hypothetical protein
MTTGTIEQRGAPRRRTRLPVPVIDTMTDQLLGQLGNLSATGMMLIGARAPTSAAIYQVSLALPGSDGAMLLVGIQEQWNEPASTLGQHWSGYRIIGISERDAGQIEAWLERTAASDY